jgi:hypothetical protein
LYFNAIAHKNPYAIPCPPGEGVPARTGPLSIQSKGRTRQKAWRLRAHHFAENIDRSKRTFST